MESLSSSTSHALDCPICYDSMAAQSATVTKCNHVFHHSCLLSVLKILKDCPICRHPNPLETGAVKEITLNPSLSSEETLAKVGSAVLGKVVRMCKGQNEAEIIELLAPTIAEEVADLAEELFGKDDDATKSNVARVRFKSFLDNKQPLKALAVARSFNGLYKSIALLGIVQYLYDPENTCEGVDPELPSQLIEEVEKEWQTMPEWNDKQTLSQLIYLTTGSKPEKAMKKKNRLDDLLKEAVQTNQWDEVFKLTDSLSGQKRWKSMWRIAIALVSVGNLKQAKEIWQQQPHTPFSAFGEEYDDLQAQIILDCVEKLLEIGDVERAEEWVQLVPDDYENKSHLITRIAKEKKRIAKLEIKSQDKEIFSKAMLKMHAMNPFSDTEASAPIRQQLADCGSFKKALDYAYTLEAGFPRGFALSLLALARLMNLEVSTDSESEEEIDEVSAGESEDEIEGVEHHLDTLLAQAIVKNDWSDVFRLVDSLSGNTKWESLGAITVALVSIGDLEKAKETGNKIPNGVNEHQTLVMCECLRKLLECGDIAHAEKLFAIIPDDFINKGWMALDIATRKEEIAALEIKAQKEGVFSNAMLATPILKPFEEKEQTGHIRWQLSRCNSISQALTRAYQFPVGFQRGFALCLLAQALQAKFEVEM